MKPTWIKPKTSRIYLQAPGAGRIALLQPDFKVNLLQLSPAARHTRQNACGVLVLAGKKEPYALDHCDTTFDTPKDGLPFYTMHNVDPENGCKLTMTAFATDDREPVIYVRVTVENDQNSACDGQIGLLPRCALNGDQYLTGLFDTGYESYQPNWKQWLLQRSCRMDPDADGFVHTEHTDGCLRVLSAKGFDVRWITREEQKDRFKAQDYYACNYTLQPGEKISLEFAFSAPTMTAVPASYEMALSRMTAYWSAMQAKITKLPDTDNERIINMFRQNVTQCLQMLAHYEGSDDLLCRQGDVGRYVWVYEAAHVMGALDRVGFSDITDPAYRTFTKWVSMEGDDKGKITYKLVVWDNAEGALIWGLGEHLKYSKNKEQLEYYRPYLHALLDFIHNRRTLDKTEPFTGLYPAGRASDWGEIGRHWTFTDAFMAHGIGSLVEALEAMNDADAPAVRAEYEDYCAAIIRTRDYLYQGHENDESFILPHIAGLSFEESYNHCFYTDGAPYLPQLGFMSGKSRMFEQMENFYRENGLFEHGLAGRLTNATDFGVGAYGDCYYTGISEFFWIYPWMERGEWDKVEETVKALFDYNVTPEFIVSERYCSIDPWYTPWQPNGSGSGRIITFLLDYCAAKKAAGRA